MKILHFYLTKVQIGSCLKHLKISLHATAILSIGVNLGLSFFECDFLTWQMLIFLQLVTR